MEHFFRHSIRQSFRHSLKFKLCAVAFSCALVFGSSGLYGAEYSCVEGVDYETSLTDSAYVRSFPGGSGTIVWAQINYKSDSALVGATFVLRYPAHLLTPIMQTGVSIPNLIEIAAVGRAGFDNPLDDNINGRLRGASVKMPDSAILKINWLNSIPTGGDGLDTVPAGSGPIIEIPFRVNDGVSVGMSAALSLEHIPVLDTLVDPPVQIACALTATAQNWQSEFGGLAILSIPTIFNIPGVSEFMVSCCDMPGDFDGSGSFNIADVTRGIDYIFNGGAPRDCQDEIDFNGDNAFNIADVTSGISHVFGGGPAPICGTTGN